jgi:hypothetical protein
MPRSSEITIERDVNASTGYSLVWGDFRDAFGTSESIELFKPVCSFRFVCLYGDFVARKEKRGCHPYWYGYKRFGSQVRKVYLGKHHRLTLHRLEEAAAQLYVTHSPAAEVNV